MLGWYRGKIKFLLIRSRFLLVDENLTLALIG